MSKEKILMVFQGLIIQMQHYILSLQKERSVIKTVPRSGVSRKQCPAFSTRISEILMVAENFPIFRRTTGRSGSAAGVAAAAGSATVYFFSPTKCVCNFWQPLFTR